MGSINLLRVFQEDEKRAQFFKIYRALRIVTLKDHPFAWIVGGKCDFQLYYYTESFNNQILQKNWNGNDFSLTIKKEVQKMIESPSMNFY